LLFGAASARLRGWMALVLLIPGLLVASQQALWGAYLLPWISWVAAAVLGFGLRKLWQQRLWRLNLDRLQRATDFQNPLIMKRMGSYLLVEKLGEGGYGAVYRGISAQTLDEGSSVAVKLFRFDKASGDEDRQRFLREARICLGLDHPGIVHVLESGEDHGFLYYTMEWVRGSNLRQWLADPHSQQQKIQVLTEMVEAMAYAHSHQVLHRDLKPENVVMQNGKPIIVDFGLALDSSSSRLTESHAVVGTLNYLSPERLGGVGNDARSDQYALGVMGYELFAGVSPFPIASAGEAIMYRLTEKPEPLVQLVGRDTFWARVVDRMMAQDPSQRFPDLAEAAALLRKGG
jgi:serine/threonine protein kinase